MKLSEWKLKMTDGVTSVLAKLSNAGDKVSAKFAGAQDRISKFQGTLRDSISEVPMLSRGYDMLTNKAVLLGASIAGAGYLINKSVHIALDFDRGLAKINATAMLSEENLGKLRLRLKEIGSESGGNFERIPDAYEKILSQTGNVNLSLDILETAVKGAKAGFTDIDVVAGALAQSLSIIGEKNATASEVLDTLLKAKAVGAGEFTDFANFLPQLIAASKMLGMSYKDTAGMFSYMTAKGQSASDSAMLMQNAFTALQKKEVMKGMEKFGLNLFNKDGSRRNIQDVFLQLSSMMSGFTDKEKSNFLIKIGLNDAQARNAFAVLTSDADKFKSIMSEVNDSLGETNNQLDKTSNYSTTWAELGDKLKSMGESIGRYLLPIIDEMVQHTLDLFKAMDWLSGKSISEMFNSKTEEQKTAETAAKFARDMTAKRFGALNFTDAKQKEYYDKMNSSFIKVRESRLANKNNIAEQKFTDAPKTLTTDTGTKPTTTLDESINKASEGISGGGKTVKSVTVNIKSLIEKMNITPATIKEGSEDIVKVVEEALLRAIRGGEVAAFE